MKPSSSSATNSRKSIKSTRTPPQQNQRKRPAPPTPPTIQPSPEELAIKAFLHHEHGYEKESKVRKVVNHTNNTGKSSSVLLGEEEELERLSKDVLQKTNKTAIDCGEDLDKLGDLETVVCYLNNRIPTTLYSIPSSILPNSYNFSILDHFKFLIPSIKKEIEEKKQQALKKTLKQPSRKTKMAITTNKIKTETNFLTRSDKQKVQKLKNALNEILKKRETRLGIFGVMPYELLLQIFSFLDWKMLHTSINCVCKDWNDSISRYEHYIISSWHHFDIFSTYCEEKAIVEKLEHDGSDNNEYDSDSESGFVSVKKTHLLTSIIENALLDYCNLNYHIIQPLLDEPNNRLISKEMLNEKVLDCIVPKVFPNVKYLTGKGLDEHLMKIFRYTVRFIDFKTNKYDNSIVNSFGPFPNLEYLQWIGNNYWMPENIEYLKKLQPLFENVKYLALKYSNFSGVAPNSFSIVFEKSCFLHTVTMGSLDHARFLDFCRAIEPHIKNIEPNNESIGLRKINLNECTLNNESVALLGSVAGHLLKVLQLNRVDALEDGLKSYQQLEELSITNSKLKPSFVDHLTGCSFGPSLKILNLRGSNFNFSSIQPSIRNMRLTGVIISNMTNQSFAADTARKERVIEFKQDLVKILNWMIPLNATIQKLNSIDLKLVLTDYGEFYFQRNNKRNHPNRYVWRNRMPPHETVTVIRNKNGTCYWEKL